MPTSTAQSSRQAIETASPSILPRERRQSTRHHVTGRVTTVQIQGEAPGEPNRISSIELCDMSGVGVGARTDHEIPEGTRLALFFPPHGNSPGFDLYGTVVRCQRNGAMHELGIELDHRLAA
jgi:hypothetical protein